MAELYRMPDLPIEHIRYLDNEPDYIILMEKYFIKRIHNKNINIEPLLGVADLNIEGLNNHKRVFIDDCEKYIYLNAPYLKDYIDTIEFLKNRTLKDILNFYKIIFSNLEKAHKNNLNPYDIKFSNYLVSKDGLPIFTDCDFIVYKGIPSIKNMQKAFFSVEDFGIENDIDNYDALNTSDKILAFQMLLRSLSYNYNVPLKGDDIERLQKAYELFLNIYKIDGNVKKYLDDFINKRLAPTDDDYFIDTVINPLLEDGIKLRKTAD